MSTTAAAQSPPVRRLRALRARLLGFVLRPMAPPLRVGIAVAVALIAAETLLVYLLRQVAPESTFGAVFLLGVLIVSAGWGTGLAVTTSVVSAVVYVQFHMRTHGAFMLTRSQDVAAIAIFVPVALLTNVLVGQARLRTAEAERRRYQADRAAASARQAQLLIEKSHAAVSALAGQQAALRRVATLVAGGSSPEEVYPAAVEELAGGLGMDHVALLLYPGDGTAVVLASRDPSGATKLTIGERLPLEGSSIPATVAQTGLPARVDDYTDVGGATAARIRSIGVRSAVGAPVTVNGQVRGMLCVGSARPHAFASDTEARVGDFADLVATAIGNAQTRAALTASRARIVTAADLARRRFERDLHDGAQQRVVALGLAMRALEASLTGCHAELREQIDRIVGELSALSTELQEFSRGIHPAVLSKGGVGAAIRSLSRRSTVPVDLALDLAGPIPESVGVATYFVVAEALTNAAKHANATVVEIDIAVADGDVHLRIRDDGVGGAVTSGGSGLIGLTDRVEALSGRLTISSPIGAGTTITARIPLDPV
ncbi:GAF domain-containing protein [Mycobacterium sp. NPDC003449]